MPPQRPGARGGTTRPGARGPRPRATDSGSSTSTGGRPVVSGSGPGVRPGGATSSPRTTRFTGRAAILVLVLAVLTVSYASSLRAYLQQRSHIGDLKAQIAEREQAINDLEREKRRWDDPAYVKAQARARFGYLMPGETGFEVLGPDGLPLEAQSALSDPDDVIKRQPTAWWTSAWDSMELAGNPPPPVEKQKPVDLVDGTKKKRGGTRE